MYDVNYLNKYMDRPRPFPRAHKQEESDGVSGTNYSPKVSLKNVRWVRMNCYLLAETEPCKRVVLNAAPHSAT